MKTKLKSQKKQTLDLTKPHQQYFTDTQQEVPGVTTVLGVINKPFLIPWAVKLTREGKDYRQVMTEATSVGKIFHFMAECFVKGQRAEISGEYDAKDKKIALNCFERFKEFWKENGLTLLESEAQLVSNKLRYGGTIDIVARNAKGVVFIIDLKTSKAIYSEYWYQISAYKNLWHENKTTRISRHAIVRIGKGEDEEMEIQERDNLDDEWNVFQNACGLWHAINKNRFKQKES